ncbi:serpin family protein [Bacteroidota bacterium]
MKAIIGIIIGAALLQACEIIPADDPEFDYNKKSAEVVNTNNEFGLELFREINEADDNQNIMISPASVSLALGMTYNGAETSTKEAFEEVLNYEGLTRDEVNKISQDLVEALLIDTRDNLVEIANSIWYNEGFPVKEDFISDNRMYYDAEIRELNFMSQGAIDEINKWVSDKTHDKIDKIIEELSPEAMMVLINALYFNCIWEYEFDPDHTLLENFYNEDGTIYGEVDLMTTESSFNYAEGENYKAVELPYKDHKYSMHLILPDVETSLNELITLLDGETWNKWIEAYNEYEEVQLTMPKFTFAFERSLRSDLIEMGLGVAFSGQADFSGISDISLLISEVIHKTYIDVNEEGTEAAAVTAVVMELTSVIPGEEKKFLRLDRPFLFAITENTSKSIVFIGKVEAPSYE